MASVELIQGNPKVVKCIQHLTHGGWKAGDLVKIASTGKAQIATAGAIFGIARADAAGTSGASGENTVVEVELIEPENVYSARYVGTTTQALQGDLLDFTFTAGAHTLDESGATTDVYCVGFDTRDVLGTSGGRLLVKFLGALATSQF